MEGKNIEASNVVENDVDLNSQQELQRFIYTTNLV